MKEVTTIGLDVAKHTFQMVGCDDPEHEVRRKVLRRGQVKPYFANLPACVVEIEACASAHSGHGRGPSPTGRIDESKPVPVRLAQGLAGREETIYGLAEPFDFAWLRSGQA